MEIFILFSNAFNFVQFVSVGFVLCVGFGFGYSFLIRKEKKKNE